MPGRTDQSFNPGMKKGFALLTLGAILYGTVIVGGQFFVQRGLSLFQIVLFSMLIQFACLLPIVLLKPAYKIEKRFTTFFLIYGLIGAGAELAQFGGLFFGVPVAVVAFLCYTQPLWTILLGRLILGEPFTGRKVAATALALAGVAVLLGPAWVGKSEVSGVGLAIALAGGVLFSLWVIWGRKSGISELHFVTTTFGWSIFTTLWLIISWPLISLWIHDPVIVDLSISIPPLDWFYLLVFTLIAGLIPNFCFFKGLRSVEAGAAGIILLLEPVVASLLAWMFFGQELGIGTLVGGFLILLSNYFVGTNAPPDSDRQSAVVV